MNRKPRSVQIVGFTLLELLVVIVLLALVTATVTTRLADTLGPAAMEQAVSQWRFADQQLRVRARRSGKPAAMNLEIGAGRIECAFDLDRNGEHAFRPLGRRVRLTKFVSSVEEVSHGLVSIRYDDRGATETYAVELLGSRTGPRWLLVAGITGQITEVANESAAREFLGILRPKSIHAG